MADHLDSIQGEILLTFLRHHKTQLSCMNNPMTFVRQLRDHRLISEEIYKRIQSTQDPETELYEALDFIETKKTFIRRLWGCVFEKHMMEKYPTLKELQDKLFKKTQLKVSSQLGKQNKVRRVVENPVSVCDEQPGSSSDVTQPTQQRPSSSSVPRMTKRNVILVTCGDQKGDMHLNELKNGRSKCIQAGEVRYTPIEFQCLGGNERYRNWRASIHYKNEPLYKYTISNGCLRKKPRRPRKVL